MTRILQRTLSNPWMLASLVALTLGLAVAACSKDPEASGPEVAMGADGVSVTLGAEELARLASSLTNLSTLISQMKQLAAGSAEMPALPDPPAVPGPPAGIPGPPPGLPASGEPPELPAEIRNRMGLEVESLLSFLDDPNTSIPFKDNLGRIVDLTTSGTGQFSTQELEELEGEVQGILGEIQKMSGPAGLVVGVPGPAPGPRPGPGPGPP